MLKWLLPVALVGCSTNTDSPTFHADVAPILADQCVACHTEDGAAFSLENYETVAAIGSQIAHVTEERIMPPFLADNSGTCQTYTDAMWLDGADIDVLGNWVESGMYEGDGEFDFSDRDELPHLEDATHLLEIPIPYTPSIAVDDDDYRCFLVDPGLTERKYLTAYEVFADHPDIVHHVIVYTPQSDEAVAHAQQLDGSDGTQGYTCYGGPVVDARVAAVWAPGRSVWSYPEGTGVPIEPGQPQIVQIHYHVDGEPVPDASSVGLKLVDSVENELLAWFYANTSLALTPDQEHTSARFESTLELYMSEGLGRPEWATDMNILGIAPHMHILGQSQSAEFTSADGSETTCLLDVPRWDFDWQYAYFLEEPVRMGPEDILRMTCDYQTIDQKETIYWGDGTDDEMCLLLLYSTFDGGVIPTGGMEQ